MSISYFFFAFLLKSSYQYESYLDVNQLMIGKNIVNYIRGKLLQKNNIGVEDIAFQSNMFFKELTQACTELKELKNEEKIMDSEVVERLTIIVKNHTNAIINFDIGLIDPCIQLPMLNKNNIFYTNVVRNFVNNADGMTAIRDAKDSVRGSVNVKTGTVSGIFTDTQSTLHLPLSMFTGKLFNPDEIAAIILHEVGHFITFCEYITHSFTTNQILSGMSKALDKSNSPAEKEAVFISIKKEMNLTDLDTAQLAKSNNKKIAEIVVLTNIAKEVESISGTDVYDITSSEHIADQYAARYGAGRQLITALEKLYIGSLNISFRSLPVYLLFEAMKIAALVFPKTAIAGIGMIVCDYANRYAEHGLPEHRFTRIKNQIIEALKEKNLSKDDHERLIADLAIANDILDNVKDRRQLFDVLKDNIMSGSRKVYNQAKLQQDLEDLAANDLFIKAAELRQLA